MQRQVSLAKKNPERVLAKGKTYGKITEQAASGSQKY